jgi:hypothetical protein
MAPRNFMNCVERMAVPTAERCEIASGKCGLQCVDRLPDGCAVAGMPASGFNMTKS